MRLSDEFLRDQTQLPQDGGVREVIADMARELLALREVAFAAEVLSYYSEDHLVGDIDAALAAWGELK